MSTETLTPLIEAVKNDDLKEARRLIDEGADVHADNLNALRWAIFNNSTEAVKLLIDSGTNPNAYVPGSSFSRAGEGGDFMIRWALKKKNLEIVKMLIGAGADATGITKFNEMLMEII